MNNEDNMDTSGEATDQPHSFRAESEDPVSNLTQLTDDITSQLARAFHITDHHDDPLFFPALFTNPVNMTATEQDLKEDPNAMSLDSSPQTLHSVFGAGAKPNTQQSPSTSAGSQEINNTTAAARNLAGILKKNKGAKTGKKVQFAASPGKVVKCYKSSPAMASWLRPLKSILEYVWPQERQTAKQDKKVIVFRRANLVDRDSDKDMDKDEEGAGTDYHDSSPIGRASSMDDLVDYIRQTTACPKQTRDPKEDWKRKRSGDTRIWNYRNPWCTKCYGECPLCGSACCVYEELRRAVADEGSDPLVARDRRRLMGLMESVAESMSARPVAEYARTRVAETSSARSGEVEAAANQPRAGAVTWHRLARLRTAPQLCQSHEQLAAETASTQPPNANRQHLVSTGCASQTFKMRTYDDSFSGQKIYPGKGKLYVRGDSKIFRFQNGKSESLFLQRKNPRRIAWTVLYRRQHKKGISEEVAKKRTRRAVKSQRAIVGASLDVIKERRAQRPEARAAARQQAIKDAKEKKAANESRKRAEKAKAAASGAKPAQRIQSKQGAKGSAPKVAAKSR
ncbi:60S ribosomal eL24 domain-containing protein [Aspergillus tubingensis]|uniref:60S ribosomal protein L24a n=3 Tax=Aspergillus subgen. Circumdati TaxID=2720871 RepID=A0A100IQU9_ASPNG|nr:60S ribosomal protein L24a [Aspergillus tubingensis]GAQ45689.1 60S ribosomal protein L24a [Aspergillus niger]GFN11652.1 60S ribosomal protein L24a [Aspergillus tubingensis]